MLKNSYKNIKILYVEDDEIARENGVEYLQNFFETIFLFSLEIHPIAYMAWATRVVSHRRQRYKIKMKMEE